MTKTVLTLTAIAALTLGVTACSSWDSPTSKPVGTYKATSKSTNPSGTDVSTDKTTYVYTDKYGNKKATEKTETTTDPKGLFNKSKTTKVETHN